MTVILIVEDDVAMRGLTELSLNEFGYETLVAGDVESALSILRTSQPIDVLFTDIYLKEHVHGGCDVAREAVKLRPGLRVLYTTGHLLIRTVREKFVDGAGCIRKPYAPEQVDAALKELLTPRGCGLADDERDLTPHPFYLNNTTPTPAVEA
jgi:DNA-binding NtrC family response regulator